MHGQNHIKNYINSRKYSSKIRVILVKFSCILNFLDTFWKNPQLSHFIKVRPVGAALFRADEQAWRSQVPLSASLQTLINTLLILCEKFSVCNVIRLQYTYIKRSSASIPGFNPNIILEHIVKWKHVHVIWYVKSSPVTGLDWPRGFQEVKVPRFHDNGTGWW